MNQKEQPHCPYCGSDEVRSDGSAAWDMSSQQWMLQGTYDGGNCAACEEEIRHFDWKKVASDTEPVSA